MSFSDLISLESQLNDSLLRVKDQKIESMVGRGSSGPQVEPEKNDNEEHLSDTSLQLGWGKRKKLKIERPAITLEVQVSSD
ncbi:hypothetical protein HID58_020677 [Brassica napus]|uniref:Uncharacterized protein n=1 Tax=Brassica napus TaxID=3708 RepID=A0ABQ8CUE4_BRANA|nr:hypothetical protein HID58_020677 [Brassica napus]